MCGLSQHFAVYISKYDTFSKNAQSFLQQPVPSTYSLDFGCDIDFKRDGSV
jgi:hypothetical protein